MSLKLAFVAAVALGLAAAMQLLSPPAIAEHAHGATSPIAVPGASPSTFARRAGMPDSVDQERRLSAGSIIGLICAIAASSIALGIAFGLRRRIDRIAGPDPEKADDD